MRTEFDCIERLRKIFQVRPVPAEAGIILGMGDDAAILNLCQNRSEPFWVWSMDDMVENVHFRPQWLSPFELGNRLVAVSFSDIAAMGATPHTATASLCLPAAVSDGWLEELARGIEVGCAALDAWVVGGNLSKSDTIALTLSVLGSTHHKPIVRSGARSGDSVYVTGTLGGAALGLDALTQNKLDDAYAPYIERWKMPKPRFDVIRALGQRVSSCIDISDGLAQDLMHICRASNLSMAINIDRIPHVEDPLFDPEVTRSAALFGGEDYELILTSDIPTLETYGLGITCIGKTVTAPKGPSIRWHDSNDMSIAIGATATLGYQHF